MSVFHQNRPPGIIISLGNSVSGLKTD